MKIVNNRKLNVNRCLKLGIYIPEHSLSQKKREKLFNKLLEVCTRVEEAYYVLYESNPWNSHFAKEKAEKRAHMLFHGSTIASIFLDIIKIRKEAIDLESQFGRTCFYED